MENFLETTCYDDIIALKANEMCLYIFGFKLLLVLTVNMVDISRDSSHK